MSDEMKRELSEGYQLEAEVMANPEKVRAIVNWLESTKGWASHKPLREYAADAPENVTEVDLQEAFLNLKSRGAADAPYDCRGYYVTALAHRILDERINNWKTENQSATDDDVRSFIEEEARIELTHPETGQYLLDRFREVGYYWEQGTLILRGNFGTGVGGSMKGGKVRVEGNAGPRAGSLMSGGKLEVSGTVGYEVGFGMTGGHIHVHKAAPAPGRRMHGGVIEIDEPIDLKLPGSNNEQTDKPWIGFEKSGGRVIVAGKEY